MGAGLGDRAAPKASVPSRLGGTHGFRQGPLGVGADPACSRVDLGQLEDGRVERRDQRSPEVLPLGWHYLSNASCLIRPRSFYARFVV